MNKDIVRQWTNLVALVAMIVVNVLANALPINGQATGEISDRFAIYFVPAGYVFSIWGVIYLALIGFAIYQLLPAQRENKRLQAIGYWFAFSSLVNIVWIFMWHYNVFALTLVLMLALLVSLIVIYLRLDIGRAKVSAAERWLVFVPFSIYLGWITVATIANITSVLYFLQWNGWGISPEAWTLIMLAAAVVIGAAVSLTRGDVAYAAVLIWAFAGIAVKHEDTTIVATAAWLAAAITAVFMLIGAYRHRQQNQNAALAT